MTLNPFKAFREYRDNKRKKTFKALKLAWIGYNRMNQLQLIINQPAPTQESRIAKVHALIDHVCETAKIFADEVRS